MAHSRVKSLSLDLTCKLSGTTSTTVCRVRFARVSCPWMSFDGDNYRSRRPWFPWRVRSRVGVAEGVWREGCVCACEREVCLVCLVAFVCCCFACDCVLELVVCRVRFERVSCPRLRFEWTTTDLQRFFLYSRRVDQFCHIFRA